MKEFAVIGSIIIGGFVAMVVIIAATPLIGRAVVALWRWFDALATSAGLPQL